jgi:hypothetical protein
MGVTEQANEDLRLRVIRILEFPLARLLTTPKVCDMYYEVFGKTLCRNCRSDKEFAYRELTKWIEDGKE